MYTLIIHNMLTYRNIINNIINNTNSYNLFTDKEYQPYINDKFTFIHIIYHFFFIQNEIVNTAKKFLFLKNMLNNPFFSNAEKEEVLTVFQKSQFYYKNFCKLAYIWKWKKTSSNINNDLYMNPINPNNKNICNILHKNCKYLFTYNDLKKIIENSLTNCEDLFTEPLPIKNPYNNIPFEKFNLYNIYFFMINKGFIVPIVFQEYFMHNFHLKIFRDNNEALIRKTYINNLLKQTNDKLIKDIHSMIRTYNTICKLNKKINIDKDFPNDILLNVMKPYLKLYYKLNYSLITTDRTNAGIDLNYHLDKFTEKHPTFGRKIIKLGNIFTKKKTIFIKDANPIILESYSKNYNTSHIEIIEDYDENKDNYISFPPEMHNNHFLFNIISNNDNDSDTTFYDSDNDDERSNLFLHTLMNDTL